MNTMHGELRCEHCGSVAVQVHPDFGTVCSACLAHWQQRQREYENEQAANELMVERMMKDYGFRPTED